MQVSKAELPSDSRSERIREIIDRSRPEIAPFIEAYKEIHKNPELSCQEADTAHRAAELLRSCHFSVVENIGGYGVVGVLENGEGPSILLRADMDALPVREKTNLPYASTKRMADADGGERPVMHACGHDMHVASLLAAASLFQNAKDCWGGCLVILFQPNEERGGGARAMLDDSLYDKNGIPRPDVVLGQHVVNHKAGLLSVGSGPAFAGKRAFRIRIRGIGAHAGDPKDSIDPVIITCYVVVRLQTIVSREIDRKEVAVVTCGDIHGGNTSNVIPDETHLTVDIRSASQKVLDKAVGAMKRIVKAECDAAGVEQEPEILETENVPALINSPEATETIEKHFKSFFGDKSVQRQMLSIASDDFGILAPKGVPYAYWTLGSADPAVWENYVPTRGEAE